MHLFEGIAKCVLQRQILSLQGGVVAFQLLQTGAHDVQDGALDGPHSWRQRYMELHHFRLMSVKCCVHRCLEPVEMKRTERHNRRRGIKEA